MNWEASLVRGPQSVASTAFAVAAARAIGAREPDQTVRNPDWLAEIMLQDSSMVPAELPAVQALRIPYEVAMRNPSIARKVRMMIVRTRYVDDALTRAVLGGVRQVVILGSGLDTYAYRHSVKFRESVVFEIDEPLMQKVKRTRVTDAALEMPNDLRYIGIDLDKQNLEEALAAEGFNKRAKSIFVMEGVSMYVSDAALTRTLKLVSGCPEGSSIVLDFLNRDPPTLGSWLRSLSNGTLLSKMVIARESVFNARRCAFASGKEHAKFSRCGLVLKDQLAIGGAHAVRMYLTRADGTEVGRIDEPPLLKYHISESFALGEAV